ncbi:MAG: hypothetical protein QF441_12770 [Bacteriovoracaceae bacterium]|jgi:hypothetical protein|nr:hypothetical protein [Halobacteriovoraceae bacterium]MDP7321478.1 hypothetical protein [Bacteriovoracaceae bacterium]
MKWILLLCFLVSSPSFAAKFIKGNGSFISAAGDHHEFVKEQLIHEAILSIVSKELENLGLNKELFWQKYEEALNERFDGLENSLKSSLKITDDASARQKRNFSEQLRRKKLVFRKSFMNMHKMLPKFAIKKLSRSSKNPNYRYIRLEGTIDTQLLTKTYYRLVQGKKRSDYGSLYVKTNYDFVGLNYVELGIENENDFEGEITKNWIDWFSRNKPINITNIEILNEAKEDRLAEFLKQPTEEMLSQVPQEFLNSLLLEIEVTIEKKKFNKKLNSFSFEYMGYAYIKDLETNIVLGTYKFRPSHKQYRITAGVNIANLVANHVYQMAIGSFPRINNTIKETTPVSQIQKLVITNFKNTGELNRFIELVESRGLKFSIRAELESINEKNAQVLMYYDGESSDAKTFLLSLEAAKKDLSYDLIERGPVLGIKFKQVTESL